MKKKPKVTCTGRFAGNSPYTISRAQFTTGQFIVVQFTAYSYRGWFCRPSFDRLQYRISDEGACECFHGGACGDRYQFELDKDNRIMKNLAASHPFVYDCKEKCWQLKRSGREVSLMWVPAHFGIAGNERADFEARQAILGNMVYNAQSVARDLLLVAKQRMLDKWQKIWEVAETGRFLHSIFPMVSFRPWFEEWRTENNLITTVSMIILEHCGVRAHLKRFSIVGSMCVCLEDHETVHHIIWKCSVFRLKKHAIFKGYYCLSSTSRP
jgi:hypothetical protein